jgi:hypothetical protein
MNWNSAIDMPRLMRWYSGICRYFSSSASQPSALSGGMAPVIGPPLGDGKARVGQPRGTANEHHQKHQRRDAP